MEIATETNTQVGVVTPRQLEGGNSLIVTSENNYQGVVTPMTGNDNLRTHYDLGDEPQGSRDLFAIPKEPITVGDRRPHQWLGDFMIQLIEAVSS